MNDAFSSVVSRRPASCESSVRTSSSTTRVDHLRGAANEVPSVHVPFGIVNAAKGTPPDVAADTEEAVNREPQDQPDDLAS